MRFLESNSLRTLVLTLLAAAAAMAKPCSAATPSVIGYQGRVLVGTAPFQGPTGGFRFALVDPGNNNAIVWNSDNAGTSAPTNDITIAVNNGLYSVLIGNTTSTTANPYTMAPLPASIFTGNNPLALRIWFNDGPHSSQLLSPDQPIAAVGYAMVAGSSDTVGGVTAANVASGANAANAATSANTASTIVARDANGSFTAGTITSSFVLPPAGADGSTGVISLNGTTIGRSLIHTYGTTNTTTNLFAGLISGNFTMTGSSNCGFGYVTLHFNTTGGGNTAIGDTALINNTTGGSNTAIGYASFYSNTTGGNNCGMGTQADYKNTTGVSNIAIGSNALYNNTGSYNIGIGSGGPINYAGGFNVTSGNFNIDIGNVGGVGGDSNTIRIGTTYVPGTTPPSGQNATFIAGIYGVPGSGHSVGITASGQLVDMTSSSQSFKDNIKPMGVASDGILRLKPVIYNFKKEIDPASTPQFGLIAEEVDKIAPELVARDANGEIHGVRYDAVNAMLLNEFLKEHKKVEQLTRESVEQKKQLAEQEARLSRLEKALEKSAK